jgi:hypothetical protein
MGLFSKKHDIRYCRRGLGAGYAGGPPANGTIRQLTATQA